MLGLLDQLADHRLNDSNVSICPPRRLMVVRLSGPFILTQESTQRSTGKGHPEVCGEANNEQGYEGPRTSDEQDRLPTNPIRYATPCEASQGLGEGEGGDEDASPERCTGSITDVEVFHHEPCIREA